MVLNDKKQEIAVSDVEKENFLKNRGLKCNKVIKTLGVNVGNKIEVQKQVNIDIQESQAKCKKLMKLFEEREKIEKNQTTQTLIRTLWENFSSTCQWIAQTTTKDMCEKGLKEYDELLVETFLKIITIDHKKMPKQIQSRIIQQLKVQKNKGGFGIGNIAQQIDSFRLGTLIAVLFTYKLNKNEMEQQNEMEMEVEQEETIILEELNEVINRILIETPYIDEESTNLLNMLKEANKNKQILQALESEKILKLPQIIRENINKHNTNEWLNHFDQNNSKEMEILRSIQDPTSSIAINADPKEYKIMDERFIILVKRRLLIPIIPSNLSCNRCKKTLDPYLEHSFACKHIGRNTIHAQIVKSLTTEIRRLNKEAETGNIIGYETPMESLVKEGYNQKTKERCDFSERNYVIDQKIALDVMCCQINEKATAENTSVKIAKEKKKNEYKGIDFEGNGWKFIPLVIDSYSKFDNDMNEYLKSVAKRTCDNLSDYPQHVRSLKTFVAIQHANAVTAQIIDELRHIAV